MGADVDLKEEIKRAIYMNDEDLLEEILDLKKELAKLQIDEDRNVQIIHRACQCENPNLVKMLIDKGADIDAQDAKQWTPMMVAAMNANLPVVRILQSYGANMLLEANDGKTAREFAQEELDKARSKKPADVNTKKQIENL